MLEGAILEGIAFAPKDEHELVRIGSRVHKFGWYLRGRGYSWNEGLMRRGQEIQREHCRCPGNNTQLEFFACSKLITRPHHIYRSAMQFQGWH